MNILQKVLMYLGAIALIAVTSIVIYNYTIGNTTEPTYGFKPGQLTQKHDFVLVSQEQNYFDVDGARRWFSSTAWIRFDWQSDNQYGVTVPPSWDWQLEHHDNQVDVVAPPLVFFGAKIIAQKATVLDRAFGVSETQMIQEKLTEMLQITEEQGATMLESLELRELALLSLENQLLNIFQQANPALGLLKVNVTFSGA